MSNLSDVSVDRLEAGNGFSARLLASAKPFWPLYALAVFTLLLAHPISTMTGTRPDYATIGGFGFVVLSLLVVLAVVIIIAKFVHMAVVERPESPSKALGGWIAREVTKDRRPINLAHTFLTISLFMTGFAVLKGAIAVLVPFHWDTTFMALERTLHLGRLPHEWLSFFVNSPGWVSFFNLGYNLWYFVLLLSVLGAGAAMAGSKRHRQYLIAFMLVWLLLGFFMALGFSSAGPCFYYRAGFGDEYVPLMDALHRANETVSVWALPTQDLLWEGFAGKRDGSAGISAFPSVHVATSTLIALYAWSLNRWLGWAAAAFALAIMIGSVVLAWHYAVDGYAGAFFAWVIWRGTGAVLDRQLRQ
ncbi:MAG: phosphatase PAP2 family protein [Pseudomonadota bacterium]